MLQPGGFSQNDSVEDGVRPHPSPLPQERESAVAAPATFTQRFAPSRAADRSPSPWGEGRPVLRSSCATEGGAEGERILPTESSRLGPHWFAKRPVALMLLLLGWLGAMIPCHAMLDANTNGMSDVWETAYNAQGVDPVADPDSDGLNNLGESIAGTDPFDPGAVLSLSLVEKIDRGYLLRWQSVTGKRYRVESASSLIGGEWTPRGPVIEGTGSEVLAAVPHSSTPIMGLRIQLLVDKTAVINGRPFLQHVDSDQDGFPDIDEWAAGTHPFDASSRLAIGNLTIGNAIRLSWPSVAAKLYQVESSPSALPGSWLTEGGMLEGTGHTLTTTVETHTDTHFFRVVITDSDSDSDSLTDWEEHLAGLPSEPIIYRTNHPTDPAVIIGILQSTNIITVEPGTAVANATQGSSGSFLVTRTGNLNAVTVHYSVGGDAVGGMHYEALPGSITFAPGENAVEIPVIPLGEAGLTPSRSVVLTLTGDPAYELGSDTSAQVNVLKEIALSVTAYGALGDGFTDDTFAIQAAIHAMEASSNCNTLYFPAGTYRLNSPVWAANPLISYEGWYELLRLGQSDLTGRDLLVTGESNAVLYSSVTWTRAQMLVAEASFRSLTFRGLTWRKTSVALPSEGSGGGERACGVAVLRHDLRRVEAVDFFDCTFDNCHAAISTYYNLGYDTRGKLAHFGLYRSRVLNPYGSNSTNPPAGSLSAGGGQQVRVSPWVAHAVYADNYFDGASDEPVDLLKNPGRVPKDGSHYGSPLDLIFTNNVVRRMGIEAVFQINDPFAGTTAAPFTIPPADGSTVVEAPLRPNIPTSFQPGQILNFRTWFSGSSVATNVFFRVVSFDPASSTLHLLNEGLTPNVEGLVIPSWQSIYLQEYNPTLAKISGNLIETVPGTGPMLSAIASNSKATISDNFMHGYSNGVLLYNNVRNPLNPPTPGTMVTGNVILAGRNSTPIYGVASWGPGEFICNNLIIAPESSGFGGVALRFPGYSWVERNTILPMEVVRHSYSDPSRSLGVTFNINGKWCTAADNRTFGLDVGVGPEVPNQSVPHWVIGHDSNNDGLAIDPLGVLPQ